MSDPGGYRSYATDDLVTGEGVAVEVPVASVAARMAGGAIDVFLVLLVLVIGAFVFGAVTAAMGERAAMACTVAVEEAIDEHYAAQAASLGEDEAELRETIERFRAEELEHRDIGLEHEAELAPAYRLMSAVIKAGCKVAIAVSERV